MSSKRYPEWPNGIKGVKDILIVKNEMPQVTLAPLGRFG